MKWNELAVPERAAYGLRRLAVSRRETAVLAAVAVMLVPLMMLEGRAFPLPSLLERGVESLIPWIADGNARVAPAAAPNRFGTLAGATDTARVGLSARSAPSSRGAISVAPGTSQRVTGSRGARASSVRVPSSAAGVRVPGGTARITAPVVTDPTGRSTPPPAGPGDGGGGSGPGTPPVSVGANATASVTVGAGNSRATGAASVSAATSGVSVAGTVADVSVGTGAGVATDSGEVATAALTPATGQSAVPDVTVTLGGMTVSTAAGLTPA